MGFNSAFKWLNGMRNVAVLKSECKEKSFNEANLFIISD